jgi:hypothetical protein
VPNPSSPLLLIHHGWRSKSRQYVVFSFILELLVDDSEGAGFHPHLPPVRYNFLAKFVGASMWFFIFYRARCVLNPSVSEPTF